MQLPVVGQLCLSVDGYFAWFLGPVLFFHEYEM